MRRTSQAELLKLAEDIEAGLAKLLAAGGAGHKAEARSIAAKLAYGVTLPVEAEEGADNGS